MTCGETVRQAGIGSYLTDKKIYEFVFPVCPAAFLQ